MRITSAAITPGTQPQSHNKKTMTMDPQPLSITAIGGQKIESNTLQILMMIINLMIDVTIGRHLLRFVTSLTFTPIILKSLFIVIIFARFKIQNNLCHNFQNKNSSEGRN